MKMIRNALAVLLTSSVLNAHALTVDTVLFNNPLQGEGNTLGIASVESADNLPLSTSSIRAIIDADRTRNPIFFASIGKPTQLLTDEHLSVDLSRYAVHVPETSSLVLLGLGFIALGLIRRKYAE